MSINAKSSSQKRLLLRIGASNDQIGPNYKIMPMIEKSAYPIKEIDKLKKIGRNKILYKENQLPTLFSQINQSKVQVPFKIVKEDKPSGRISPLLKHRQLHSAKDHRLIETKKLTNCSLAQRKED